MGVVRKNMISSDASPEKKNLRTFNVVINKNYMKTFLALAITGLVLVSCNTTPKNQLTSKTPRDSRYLAIISGTTIEKGDTVVTYIQQLVIY